MKNIINKFKRFCKTELGFHTMEDFFSSLFAVMFAGGMVAAGLILVYITVSVMGGLFYTLVTIGLSLLSIFILGVITWLIVYIFEKG